MIRNFFTSPLLHAGVLLVLVLAAFNVGSNTVYAINPVGTIYLSDTGGSPVTIISIGQSIKVNWAAGVTGYATSCTGTNFNTGGATSGTNIQTPATNTTYTVVCHYGSAPDWTGSATITVSSVPLPTASLSAAPASIAAGGSSTLSWGSTNSSSCTGTNFTTGGALSGTAVVSPTVTSIYTVTCTGAGGSASDSEQVTVAGVPTATLSASPQNISAGGSSTLSYECTDSTSASIDHGVGSVSAASGTHTVSVSPASNTTYTLTCTVGSQSSTAQAPVHISTSSGPPLSATCSASPSSALTGQTVTWSSSVSGGTPPYTYTWEGTDGLSGKSGSQVNVVYSTPGTKTGTSFVSDSSTNTASTWDLGENDGTICTGPVTAPPGALTYSEDYAIIGNSGYISPHDWMVGDGENYARSDTPADFPSNLNYCVQGILNQGACNGQNCVPLSSSRLEWHVGGGIRAATASDYPSNNSYTSAPQKWFGTITFTSGSPSTPQPQSVYANCTTAVVISAPNQPPSAPILSGVYDSAGVSYYGSTAAAYAVNGYREYENSVDPDGDNVDYYVYFYNNQTGAYTSISPQWSGWVGSGGWGFTRDLINLPAGNYQVGAYAIDSKGAWSPFSGWQPITLTDTPCSATNACGTNSGTVISGGVCSVSAPALPPGYGTACNSAPNACGQTNAGVVACNGACSVSSPSNATCPAPSCTLTATPSTVNAGQSSLLTWSCSPYTASCTAAGGFSTGGAANNATGVSVSPPVTSNYQLTCTNTSGVSAASNIATLTVNQPNVSISANPVRLPKGTTSNISWSATSVKSCVVNGPTASDMLQTGNASAAGLFSQIPAGPLPQIISKQSTYTITCQTFSATTPTVSKSVIVNISGDFHIF